MDRNLPSDVMRRVDDGIRGPSLDRQAVDREVRRVMLSAIRAGWKFADIHPLLTDASHRRLAQQIATGSRGRALPPGVVSTWLLKRWEETERFAASSTPWSRDDALGFIAVVQDSLDGSDLRGSDRDVIQVAIDLANQHGTAQPAVPARVVADRLRLDKSKAYRILKRLSMEGEWLSLAQRGTPGPVEPTSIA